MSSPSQEQNTVTSAVDSAPTISTAPGQDTNNERYRELQQQANEEKSEQAKSDMTTFVPTLVNRSEDDNDLLDRLLEEKRREKNAEELARQKSLREAQELSQRRLKEQQERMDKLRQEQESRRLAAEQARLGEVQAKEYQKLLEQQKKVFLDKITSINETERYTPRQQYISGAFSEGSANTPGAGGTTNQGEATRSVSSSPLYKAGTILYAVVETSLNTDEPSPILAKITSGPLAGSRLIGSSQGLGSQWSQAIVLQFNTISIPMMPQSQSIECIAVDPVTARTALADSVNNHYIQRYGSLFFSKLIEGYAQAIQTSGSTTETDSNGNETTTNSETSDAENLMIALGNVGTAVGTQVASVINRPATITINQGSAIGLLLLSDFTIES
mgnify:CR=1 FL=1